MAPSRSEGPFNERKRALRIELKTKNKTKVEVLYKKGSFAEVFAIELDVNELACELGAASSLIVQVPTDAVKLVLHVASFASLV